MFITMLYFSVYKYDCMLTFCIYVDIIQVLHSHKNSISKYCNPKFEFSIYFHLL